MKQQTIQNHRDRVPALILVGLAAPERAHSTVASNPHRYRVMDQQCAGGNGVNVTLTATLSPPKSGAAYKWILITMAFSIPSQVPIHGHHSIPMKVRVTATVAVMKGEPGERHLIR
jgi:hypothetical protein